eukprot:gene1507-2904_t
MWVLFLVLFPLKFIRPYRLQISRVFQPIGRRMASSDSTNGRQDVGSMVDNNRVSGSGESLVLDTPPVPPSRAVICQDALEWLKNLEGDLPGSVFTSLPDISELQIFNYHSNPEKIHEYKSWFRDAVSLIFSKMAPGSYAIFLQSDVRIKINGRVIHWIDKSHLCSSAADLQGMTMLWHKNVLTTTIEKHSLGRPTYSHLVCYGKALVDGYENDAFSTPDIFPRGDMVWPKGIGLDCCLLGVSFLQRVAQAHTVVDPFCGQGTVLAVANALGMHAIGVELSIKRCRKARSLRAEPLLAKIPASRRRNLGSTWVPSEVMVHTDDLIVETDDDPNVDDDVEVEEVDP